MTKRQKATGISPVAIYVLTMLCMQVTADPEPAYNLEVPSPEVYTLGSGLVLESRAKKEGYIAHQAGDLVCRPFGLCEPCPADELNQPFCQPFGNRRLLHCKNKSHDSTKGGKKAGEVPAWEACGKVVKKERQDFWEFVTCNLLFLIVAMTILWARTSALATAQYRQLAARIGIPGSGWRG